MYQQTTNPKISTENISSKRKPTSDLTSSQIIKRQKTQESPIVVVDVLSSDEEAEENSTGTISSKKRKSTVDATSTAISKKQKTRQETTNVVDLLSSEEESDEDKSSSILKEQVTDPNPLILDYKRISLFKNDLKCLKKKEWLKDNVVDLALAELEKRPDNPKQSYLFNSLFFSKLRSIKESNSNKKEYYATTKRWFKNEELSNKRFWIVPVCDKSHWYVVVVARPRSNRPVIIVLDSIKKKKYESINLIKAFLRQKYESEHSGKCRKIEVEIVDIPQQTNASDCGLFAIRSAALFLAKTAQHYYDLIKDPTSHESKLSQIYENLPVPTRRRIYKVIQNLAKTF